MKQTVFSGTRSEQIRFLALLGFLLLCLLGGGASRADIWSLLYLRPAAILCIATMLLSPGPIDFRGYRIPFLLMGALAALILLQLIPLPPDLWQSLPGRERYAFALAAAGGENVWRPISLTPDLTLNAAIALIVPLAALIGFAAIRRDQRQALLPALLVAACASAVLGIVQLSSGDESSSYLYEVTHSGSAVGFFSNRNHQAALLAMAFPMLRLWTLMPTKDEHYGRMRFWTAAGMGLLLVPMLLVTGSRAGIGLGLVGLLAAFLVAPIGAGRAHGARRWGRVAKLVLVITPLALAAAVILFGRAVAIDRLAGQDLQAELRVQHTPLMLDMVRDFFPVGTGFGSFDPVFRNFEPDGALSDRYFNHAHNDLIELALNGGAAALLLLAAFLIWWVSKSVVAFRTQRIRSPNTLLARLGAIMIMILFLGSVVDYPLRTPFMAVVFVIACGWLARAGSTPESAEDRLTS